MPRRYAFFGACFGFAVGGILAAVSWRQFLSAGHRPPFMLELMSFVVAPPFGLLLSYPIAAITGFGTAGFLAWVVLTPMLNWALIGLLVGAIRHIRASNRNLGSRPVVIGGRRTARRVPEAMVEPDFADFKPF